MRHNRQIADEVEDLLQVLLDPWCDGEIGIGVDYGQKNATTFQAFGIDYNHRILRGLDEYYHSGRDEGRKSPSIYAAEFKAFVEKLERLYPDTKIVNRLMTHSWGQKVVRFYDPDGNLIEVGTPI